jgi:hypothetical protein
VSLRSDIKDAWRLWLALALLAVFACVADAL